MDLLSLNSMQRLLSGAAYNEFFPDKPVFAYHTGTTSSSSAMVDFYRSQERRAMRMHALGSHAQNSAVPQVSGYATSTEAGSHYYWGGATNSETSTNGFNPMNGYQGLPSFSHTMCLNNREFTDEGVFSYQAQNGNAYATIAGMGVVLGEEGYEQGIDLLKIGGNLFVSEIGDEALNSRTQEQAVNWWALPGLSRMTNPTNNGNGDVGYNRTNNTLAFIERSSTAYNYRLHVFKNLSQKLNHDAGRLKALLEDAIAGRNGSSYETFDFTWSGNDLVEWHDGTRLIVCDDGTFWLGRMAPSAYLALGRIYKNAGAWTFQIVNTLGATTSYGREQGNPYGVRHTVSEDGKYVAFYAPYYYYLCGGNFFFVPRDTANVVTRFRTFRLTDTARGMSIAPFGGSDFVIGQSVNSDSRERDGVVVRMSEGLLNGSIAPSSGFNNILISGWSQSTSYGVSGFVRVLPSLKRTTEMKERI